VRGLLPLSDYIDDLRLDNLVVITTDLGFASAGVAANAQLPLAFIEKRRTDNAEQPKTLALIGDVRDKNVLLVDDEVLTGKSVENAISLLQKNGAKDFYVAFTHAILSGGGVERLARLPIKEIVTTNTLPVPPEKRLPNMTVLSVAPLRASHYPGAEGRSVGALFDE
jgi:ribose-phosphate pyrophosphokinase